MNILKYYEWDKLNKEERAACLARPSLEQSFSVSETVAQILKDVKARGDEALREYTLKFDGVELKNSLVTEEEIVDALLETSTDLQEALLEAIRAIRSFHEAQRPTALSVETTPGVVCEKRSLPLEKVGLYIPGGSAPLPSTLIMLVVPALVAGCSEIVLTTPPNKEGKINSIILVAASLLGIKTIYKCGGAQAIGALAYGTKTIPKVDKIFGPGNAWVTEAKMQVSSDASGAAMDLPAGPSEVLVIADGSAQIPFVAADLLSQAEHDTASQVILVSSSQDLIERVQKEVALQLETLPRKNIATRALESSRAILAKNLNVAMEISNQYAPEHLILQVEKPRELAESVRHAGSVFMGAWSPESVGDYASGTNHVLPTYGFARAFSGLGLEAFMKTISFQELSPAGLQNIGPVVEKLAKAEGLTAHERAVTIRLDYLRNLK